MILLKRCPRGIKKALLALDGWLKDVAPSTELRRWFGHGPAKWKTFQHRSRTELQEKPQFWKPLLDAARKGTITLVFSSHDVEHNNAVVLKQFLESHLGEASKADEARLVGTCHLDTSRPSGRTRKEYSWQTPLSVSSSSARPIQNPRRIGKNLISVYGLE